jgi:arginase
VIRRLLGFVRPHRLGVIAGAALGLVAAGLGTGSVASLAPILNVVFEDDGVDRTLALLRRGGALGESAAGFAGDFAAGDPVRLMGLLLGGLFGIALLNAAVTFAHKYVVEIVTTRTQLDIAESLYDGLTRHDEGTLARLGMGNLTARFSYDLDMSGKAITTLIGTLVLSPARFLFSLGAAVWLSWQLTLASLLLVPPVALFAQILGRRIRKAAEGMLEKRAGLLSRVQETVHALPAVQVYGQEERESRRFRAATGRVFAWAKRLARLEASADPSLQVAEVIGIAPLLFFGGVLVTRGELAVGTFLTVFFLLAAAWGPLRKVIGAASRLQGGVAGARRIFETLDLPRAVEERPGARELPPLSNEVSWTGVRVVYPDGRVALDGVTLRAPAGRTTALVGPSGAGKTTLLHTLPRLLDPTEGAAALDGTDVRDATLSGLRGRMALVTQDARLFGGTLSENVAYARPGAARDEIEAAGRVARVDEIVARLPDGWDTLLEEGGVGLSGGERQRVAIARAVLRDPEILLLDEPTSALDPENERLVRDALAVLSRDRTTIVVAHRRETVLAADHVVVLRDGRVEAEGPPDDVDMTRRHRIPRRPISVVGVRLDLGAGRRGTDMGPSAVRIAGLHDALHRAGFKDHIDLGDIDTPAPETLGKTDSKARHLGPITAVCKKVAKTVRKVLDDGRVPVVIGGDHSCAVGTFSGVAAHFRRRRVQPGIVWVDAHGDMNTPKTTRSGNVHGMPLAHLLGMGREELVDIAYKGAKVPADRVALVGIRDLDYEERKVVSSSGVAVFTMKDIDERGMPEVMREAISIASGSKVEPFHVSFDVDGVDPEHAPGVGTAVQGGLTYREAHLAMELVAESGRMCSVELVEINPILDVGNRTGKLAMELILSALGKRIYRG